MQPELYWHPVTEPGVQFNLDPDKPINAEGTVLLRVPLWVRPSDFILGDGHRTEEIVEQFGHGNPYVQQFRVTIPPAALVTLNLCVAANAC